ncbi:MAG: hypothetical protein ACK5Q5_24620 [Planctomycetaceae bacterium]
MLSTSRLSADSAVPERLLISADSLPALIQALTNAELEPPRGRWVALLTANEAELEWLLRDVGLICLRGDLLSRGEVVSRIRRIWSV